MERKLHPIIDCSFGAANRHNKHAAIFSSFTQSNNVIRHFN